MRTAQEFMFRKEAMERCGGFVDFPLAFFSDDATWCKLSRNGVACSMETLFTFRSSGLNISSNREPSERMLRKLDACFQYVKWMREYLSHVECRSDADRIFMKAIYRGLENKLAEWLNWTSRRCTCGDFLRILRNREWRTHDGLGRWSMRLLHNIHERFFLKTEYD